MPSILQRHPSLNQAGVAPICSPRLLENGDYEFVKACREEESLRNRQRVKEIRDWIKNNGEQLQGLITKDDIDEDGFIEE